MATARPARPSSSLGGVERAILIGSGFAVMLVAWLWLERTARFPHAHVALTAAHRTPLDTRSFVYLVTMWQIMAVAMMTPTLVKWVSVWGALVQDRSRLGRISSVFAFTSGYFSIWLGYSVLAAGAQALLQLTGFLHGTRGIEGLPADALLILAGVVQFTPLKRACLSHCRNPLSYFLARWPNGPTGGFRVGLEHGRYCLGCCWALMATAFALGVMNVMWMVVLTLIVSIEQIVPSGDRVGRAFGLALVGWGLAMLTGQA